MRLCVAVTQAALLVAARGVAETLALDVGLHAGSLGLDISAGSATPAPTSSAPTPSVTAVPIQPLPTIPPTTNPPTAPAPPPTTQAPTQEPTPPPTTQVPPAPAPTQAPTPVPTQAPAPPPTTPPPSILPPNPDPTPPDTTTAAPTTEPPSIVPTASPRPNHNNTNSEPVSPPPPPPVPTIDYDSPAPALPPGASSAAPLPAALPSPTEDPLSPSPPSAYTEEPVIVRTSRPPPFTNEIRESNAPTATPTPTSTSDRPPPIEYSVGGTGSTTDPPQTKPYRRGDSVVVIEKNLTNGSTVQVEVVISRSDAPSLLARDSSTLASGQQGAVSSHVPGWVSFFKYATSILAWITLLLLILCHFIAATSTWTAYMPCFLRPNEWELLAFITYVQAMASTAHYTITAVPASLWQFLDAFSWTVFVPFHHDSSAVSVTSRTPSRRLSEYVVLDGVVAFSDRVGVDETDLLQTSAVGMLVMSAFIALLALAMVVFVKHQEKKDLDSKHTVDPFGYGVLPRTLAVDDTPPQPVKVPFQSTATMKGIAVVLAVIAFFPITMLSLFEVASEIRAGEVSSVSLAVAVIVIMVIPVGLAVSNLLALRDMTTETQFTNDQTHRVVWGVLASSECVRYDRRLVFASSWLGMQLASAIVVGSVLSASWQLALLLAIDVLYLLVVLVTRPFGDDSQLAMCVTIAVSVVKIFYTCLACAFLTSSRSRAVAIVFILLNALVLCAWAARVVVITVRVAHAFWSQQSPRKNTAQSSLPESQGGAAQAVMPTQSPSDAQYESALYVALAPTEAGHRRTAVL